MRPHAPAQTTSTSAATSRVSPRVSALASLGTADGRATESLDATRDRGDPLPQAVATDFGARFGHDFGHVRVHTDRHAEAMAGALSANAFARGSDVYFARGRYAPHTTDGRRLLAHELAHVVQSDSGHGADIVRRQVGPFGQPQMGPTSADMEAELIRQGPPPGWTPPTGTGCGRPPHCPPAFCEPYSNPRLAEFHKARDSGFLLAGISLMVSSRVVPVWRDYLSGGTGIQDFTPRFGSDFASSPATGRATTHLRTALQAAMTASPPTLGPTGRATVDIATTIPGAVRELGDPASRNQMNFSAPRDIAGNLAGGIGTNQRSCRVGRRPSPIDDTRTARGSAAVTRTAAGLVVQPTITFRVEDTVDLCPGDCGAPLERVATVPMSQWEATGIAGDVPFTVEFSPPVAPFTIPIAAPAPVVPPRAPAPGPTK